VHERATIEGLAHAYLAALRALIAHCQSGEAGGFTPSDFPKARISQKELDTVLARMRHK
jgi:non-ribosomal peptide synthase protein (TIGR01720 family)